MGAGRGPRALCCPPLRLPRRGAGCCARPADGVGAVDYLGAHCPPGAPLRRRRERCRRLPRTPGLAFRIGGAVSRLVGFTPARLLALFPDRRWALLPRRGSRRAWVGPPLLAASRPPSRAEARPPPSGLAAGRHLLLTELQPLSDAELRYWCPGRGWLHAAQSRPALAAGGLPGGRRLRRPAGRPAASGWRPGCGGARRGRAVHGFVTFDNKA